MGARYFGGVGWVVLALLGGCTTQRLTWQEPRDDVHIAPQSDLLHVTVRMPQRVEARQPVIDTSRSWAELRGTRYLLGAERNRYHTGWSTQATSQVYLVDPDPEGRRIDAGTWRGGQWRLHLALAGKPPAQDIEVAFELRTHPTLGLWPVVFGAKSAP